MTAVGAQFEQLPLYMTAEEMGHLRSADFPGKRVSEVNESTMQNEFGHNYASGRRGDSENAFDHVNNLGRRFSDGIFEPAKVTLSGASSVSNGLLMDGHHRSVLARRTRQLIPVDFYEKPGAGQSRDSRERSVPPTSYVHERQRDSGYA